MPTDSSLHYELNLVSRSRHVFGVRLHIPATDKASLTVSLPAWIPGSYMIRDFARNIIALAATTTDGTALAVHKQDKQTWVIDTNGQAVVLNYEVFAFDLSVRSAYINDQYAFCNGTSVFLQVAGFEEQPHSVDIRQPELTGWQLQTSMPQVNEHYGCDNYLELIDHPIFLGICQQQSFTVQGVEFVVLFSGDAPVNLTRICRDLEPVCAHHLDLFGAPAPVSRYVFMTLVADTGFGGLEHKSSTALVYPRFDLPQPGENGPVNEKYGTFLSLCSHELFHTWHVKRIKPANMVKPDMAAEVYTDQLWIYEGFTSFYDDLTLARCGLISPERYLEIVGQNLTRLAQTPGRKRQSAAASSFDAWTRFYKQDASSLNHIVSYYTKGGIIAMGLDLLLRRQSDGQYSLDDVMRHLWQQFGKQESGTPDDVIARLCADEFGIDITEFLNKVVYGTDDVPLETWLADIGVTLRSRPRQNSTDKGGTPLPKNPIVRRFGATVKNAATGVLVQSVSDGSPAERAGVQLNDVILALDGWVVNDALLQRLLDTAQGETVKLTVMRDGRLLELPLAVQAVADDAYFFSIDEPAKLQQWLQL